MGASRSVVNGARNRDTAEVSVGASRSVVNGARNRDTALILAVSDQAGSLGVHTRA